MTRATRGGSGRDGAPTRPCTAAPLISHRNGHRRSARRCFPAGTEGLLLLLLLLLLVAVVRLVGTRCTPGTRNIASGCFRMVARTSHCCRC